MSLQTITPAMASALGLSKTTASSCRMSGRGSGGGRRSDGWRHPGFGGWSAGRQPADRELQLPSQRFDRQGAAGRAPRRDRAHASASRRRRAERLRFRVADGETHRAPVARTRHPRRRNRSAHCRLGQGLRSPYGIIVVARAAGATSEVPVLPKDIIRSLNNRRMVDAAGAPRRGARARAGRAGDPADPARREVDVCHFHTRLTSPLEA